MKNEEKKRRKESLAALGIAMTREQTSDTVTEGTIDGEIDDINGKDIPLNRKEKKE